MTNGLHGAPLSVVQRTEHHARHDAHAVELACPLVMFFPRKRSEYIATALRAATRASGLLHAA